MLGFVGILYLYQSRNVQRIINEINIDLYLKNASDINVSLYSLIGIKIREYQFQNLPLGYNSLKISDMEHVERVLILNIKTNDSSYSYKIIPE
jgi:hypothetical protein